MRSRPSVSVRIHRKASIVANEYLRRQRQQDLDRKKAKVTAVKKLPATELSKLFQQDEHDPLHMLPKEVFYACDKHATSKKNSKTRGQLKLKWNAWIFYLF